MKSSFSLFTFIRRFMSETISGIKLSILMLHKVQFCFKAYKLNSEGADYKTKPFLNHRPKSVFFLSRHYNLNLKWNNLHMVRIRGNSKGFSNLYFISFEFVALFGFLTLKLCQIARSFSAISFVLSKITNLIL